MYAPNIFCVTYRLKYKYFKQGFMLLVHLLMNELALKIINSIETSC